MYFLCKRKLKIVNEVSSLTVVNNGSFLTVVKKGSSLTVGKEELFWKTVVFEKLLLKNENFRFISFFFRRFQNKTIVFQESGNDPFLLLVE